MGYGAPVRVERTSTGDARRPGTRRGARALLGGTALVAASALVAACAPPPTSPPAPPTAPTITRFVARAERTEAPVLATLGWTIVDPNPASLRCRVDTDGDGTFDREIEPCSSTNSLLAEFDTEGQRTLTLEVSDGVFDPVIATTTLEVEDGPSEDYEITLRLDPGMRPEFRTAFEAAADRWSEAIVAGASDQFLDLTFNPFGFPSFVGTVDDVLIDARDVAIDGPGKVLGRAGGFAVRESHWQPYYGIMEFDTADLEQLANSGRLGDVILHEMGHVLGLGANWLLLDRITGFPLDPHYTGPAGVAAYQELGGSRYVPVEDQGGLGTAFAHWRESVFGNELMTGYLGSGVQPMSRLTISALADLGYGVDLSAADPYTVPSLPGVRAPEPADHLHTEPIEPGIITPSN